MTAAAETTCAVCSEAAEEPTSTLCGECDQPFHLNQRNDVDGKDCGDVWIDELYLSLRYACFNCLRGETAASEPDEPAVGERH